MLVLVTCMHASTYLAIIATHKNYYHNSYPRAPAPLLCINFDLVSVAPAWILIFAFTLT